MNIWDYDNVTATARAAAAVSCAPSLTAMTGNAAALASLAPALPVLTTGAETVIRQMQQMPDTITTVLDSFRPALALYESVQEQHREYMEATKAPARCLRGCRCRAKFDHLLDSMCDDRKRDDDASFIEAVRIAWLQVLHIMLTARTALSEVNRSARRAGELAQAEQTAYKSLTLAWLQRRSRSSDLHETIRLIIAVVRAPRAPQPMPFSGSMIYGCRRTGL